MYVLELAGEDDDFAIAEAAAAADGLEPLAAGLVVARTIDPARLRGLAYTRAASDLVGRTTGSIGAAVELLDAEPIGRAGTVAVRARDVRGSADVDARAAERALGDVLTAQGLAIDLEAPDHELRALFADGMAVVGWLTVESRRDFGERAPTDKPFFHPGSMDPLDARAVANLARAAPDTTVLDPLCGTGGLLVEAGLLGASVLAMDAQSRMVRGTRQNFQRYLTDWAVLQGDATRLPIRGPVDAVIADVPYGRQSAVAGQDVDSLLRGFLTAARRLSNRAVVVADRERSEDALDAGWRIEAVYERRVHRSLTRYVHVLE